MPEVAKCDDDECPSRLKCFRFLSLAESVGQTYIPHNRKMTDTRCGYFMAANCCETSVREWGPGNYEGEEADCMFCNRTHQWTGQYWKGVYP